RNFLASSGVLFPCCSMIRCSVFSTSILIGSFLPHTKKYAPPRSHSYSSDACFIILCCTYIFSFWSLEKATFIFVNTPVSCQFWISVWYKKSVVKCCSPKNNQFLPVAPVASLSAR